MPEGARALRATFALQKAFAPGQRSGWNSDMAERKTGDRGVQGEGDYRSARAYKRDIDKFMSEKSGQIGRMATDAGKALDGPERKELEKAEQKGKSKVRH